LATTLTPPPQKDTPIFVGHGDQDNVVQTSLGVTAASRIKAARGADENGDATPRDAGHGGVTLKLYQGMAHSSCDEEMKDLSDYIASRA
jgi:predicted esterase